MFYLGIINLLSCCSFLHRSSVEEAVSLFSCVCSGRPFAVESMEQNHVVGLIKKYLLIIIRNSDQLLYR